MATANDVPSLPAEHGDVATSTRTFVRSAGLVGILTLMSRLTGFVRELLMARTFGTSQTASALVVAQNIPNLSRSVISEDVAHGALVPPLTERLLRDDEESAWRLTWVSTLAASVILLVLSATVFVFAGALVDLIAAEGSGAGFSGQASHLLRVLSVIVLTNGPLAASSAFLVARGSFGIVGTGSVLSNVPVLVGLFVLSHPSAEFVAVLIVVGYTMQMLFLGVWAWTRRPEPGLGRASLTSSRSDLAMVGRLALPIMLSLGMANFSGIIDVAFSTQVGSAGPAALDKGLRLMFMPYGVFSMAMGIVALPSLVQAGLRSSESFDGELERATRFQAVILVPLCICMAVFAELIVRLAFERGAFDPSSTRLTADALIGAAYALPALGCSLVGTRAWISRKRPWIPAGVAAVGLVVNALLDAVLVGPLGLRGIGLSTALVHLSVGLVLILTAARDRARFARVLASFGARFAVAAGAASGLGMYVAYIAGGGDVARLGGLGVAVALLLVLTWIVGLRDYAELFGAVKRR